MNQVIAMEPKNIKSYINFKVVKPIRYWHYIFIAFYKLILYERFFGKQGG
jgi:hypothetical protein